MTLICQKSPLGPLNRRNLNMLMQPEEKVIKETGSLSFLLLNCQADAVTSVHHVDEDLVNDVVALGFDREMLLDSLKKRVQNKVRPWTAFLLFSELHFPNNLLSDTPNGINLGSQATVTYYLVLDNSRHPSNAFLTADMSGANVGGMSQFHSQQQGALHLAVVSCRISFCLQWMLFRHDQALCNKRPAACIDNLFTSLKICLVGCNLKVICMKGH